MPTKRQWLQAAPFAVLFALAIATALVITPGLFRTDLFSAFWANLPDMKDAIGVVAYRPQRTTVDCPDSSYEHETIHLLVLRWNLPRKAKPALFTIETSDDVEVQGKRQQLVMTNAEWILVPKEQGEYEVVVRGPDGPTMRTFDLRLRVYRLDHIPRREFVAFEVLGGVIGAIGVVVSMARRKDPS